MVKICNSPLFILMFISCFLLAFPVGAASRYQQWRSGENQLEKLLGELDQVVADGIRDKAAHPSFLLDLQKVINRYRKPSRALFFHDDFSDGNYTSKPAWQVTSGQFMVDGRRMLHSQVDTLKRLEPAQPSSSQGEGGGGESKGDNNIRLLLGIVGTLVNKGERPGGAALSSPRREEVADIEKAVISSKARVGNAFTLQFDLISHAGEGEMEMGLFQGSSLTSGYRLVYRANASAERPLQIVKYLRGSGYVVGDSGGRSPRLDDGRSHKVVWRRSASGKMTVSINGREVMSCSDMSYRQDFDGLVVVNGGGEYAIDNIQAYNE